MQTDRIGRMFDSIAPSYDSLNHLFSLGIDRCWRRRSLKEIEGVKVLDIACGTGDFAIDEATRLPQIEVTGVDISEGMLTIMRRKTAAKGLDDRIRCEVGNCLNLRFEDASFDTVSIGFGIRNFARREDCLKETLRVLKPGGKLVILELSVPENALLKWIYCLYFRHVMPFIGGLVSGDKAAYRYLPASVLAFPGRKEWMKTMGDAGYCDITHRSFSAGLCRLYTGRRSE